jgi:hypothetical protein
MTEKEKVAILFFGLTRSTDMVLDSIQKKLFNPITEAGLDYDIFLHTYILESPYINEWSKENITNYDNDQYKLLNPKHYVLDRQSDIIQQTKFEEYYTKLGNWAGMTPEMTKVLIRNFVLGLYSKKRVTELFREYADNYKYVIIMRPDMRIVSKINIQECLKLVDTNVIVVPAIDWFNGCNDKMCIAKKDAALYYGTLSDKLLEYSQRTSIMSERFLLDMLVHADIVIRTADIRYVLIRASNNPQPTQSK